MPGMRKQQEEMSEVFAGMWLLSFGRSFIWQLQVFTSWIKTLNIQLRYTAFVMSDYFHF